MQKEWFPKYRKQANAPEPAEMLLNVDAEPSLEAGFNSLFNGKDFSDWEVRGGKQVFEIEGDEIVGTCVPREASGYLSTKKTDYLDFVFTCEMKWDVDLNSGVMFRAQSDSKNAVFGPQVEMEGINNQRGWSGGIYGQSCGGYFYPLWLVEHQKVRKALNKEGWNRVTVEARGKTVKTWLNGVPAAHWVGDGTYAKGYFGLQVHKAAKGKVRWRGLKVKELKDSQARIKALDAYWADVSRSVQKGDFEGYKATCHEKAVLVSGSKETSYPLSQALAKWQQGFDDTKAGKMDAVFAELQKQFVDESVLFIKFDYSSDCARHQAELLSKDLGLGTIFKEYKRTGDLILVSPRGEVRGVMDHRVSIASATTALRENVDLVR